MIIQNDCLYELGKMKSSTIDLIYLDPPFFTQKMQKLEDSQGYQHNFEDIWESRSAYLAYMKVRMEEMRRLLKDIGSIFLHCDGKSSHYLRILMDEIFGENNFRSEIIWTYRRWSNSKRGLLPAHQTIFFYSKTDRFKFRPVYTEYSPTTNLDQILQERVRDQRGKAIYRRNEAGETVISKRKRSAPVRCLGNPLSQSEGTGKGRLSDTETHGTA